MSEDRFIVGRILAAWGLQGELAVQIISTNPERFRAGNTVYADGTPLTVARVRGMPGKVIVSFREILTRDQADELRGVVLDVPEADLPDLGPEEYYHHQILGLQVSTTDGRNLGTITEILPTGANDVYLIHDGKREYLIPAIADVIRSVDLAAKLMTIESMPGLLD